MGEHWVAATRGRDRSLVWPERADWLWRRLRLGFPAALSCVLMPDHVHLVVPAGQPQRHRLQRILAGFTTRFGVRFDIVAPAPAHSVAIVGRTVRYGLLNPVRAGLVDDPFAWPWSSLRDLVGASAPSWTPLSRVAATLRLSPADALRGLSTLGGVTHPAPRRDPAVVASVDAVGHAVRSALRIVAPGKPTTTARRLTVAACFAIGRPAVADLAAALGCSVRSIHRDRMLRPPALDAVLLCLGDARLRIGPLELGVRERPFLPRRRAG